MSKLPKFGRPELMKMTKPELAKLIRAHNLHYVIKGYSRLNKSALVAKVHEQVKKVHAKPKDKIQKYSDGAAMGVNDILRYVGFPELYSFAMLYVLDRNGNNCIFGSKFEGNQSTINAVEVNNYQAGTVQHRRDINRKVGAALIACQETSLSIMLHSQSSIGYEHAGALIITRTSSRGGGDANTMFQVERFEPYGEGVQDPNNPLTVASNLEMDDQTEYFTTQIAGYIERSATMKAAFGEPRVTVYDPDRVCPRNVGAFFKGIQTLEENPGVPASAQSAKDPGGYCAMWSLMFMDWRLSNPHVPGNLMHEELIRRCVDDDELPMDVASMPVSADQKCSIYLRRLVRGFTKDVFARLIATLRNPRTSGKQRLEEYIVLKERNIAHLWNNLLPANTPAQAAKLDTLSDEIDAALQRYQAEVTAG